MTTETALVVPTMITKTHGSLADKFVTRVVTQLNEPFKIKKYGVECDWRETETIELEFDNGDRVVISVSKKINT